MKLLLITPFIEFSRKRILRRMVGFMALLFTMPLSTSFADGAIPEIMFYPDNPAKAFVLSLTFVDGGPISYDSGFVSLNPAGGYPDGRPDVGVGLIDVYSSSIANFTLPSPLRMRVYNADGTDSEKFQSTTQSDIHFPFGPDASVVSVSDNLSNSEVTVDLKPIIQDFCVGHLDDPECYETDIAISSSGAVDPPPLVLLGQPVNLTVRTIIDNNGPEAKPAPPAEEKGVDALFDQQVTNVSQGVTVTPSGITGQQEFGLKVGASRTNDHTYVVTCLEPGLQEATFTSTIEPLSAAVIEPHEVDTTVASNNTKAFVLSVDCAVPVTLNNKPHSFPNSVNLDKSGDVPVAVLTTEQGEYGNPLAFDAQTIDPLTVHYGVESLASYDNGATESHEATHIKDSYELDDKTRDKDLDAVMHFPAKDTGLSSGDTETCIKGKFTDGGNTFTFFGCDSVNVIE